MSTLTITRGLPGCGKSTWARTKRAWRVNRDDLRTMVLSGPWPHGDRYVEDLLTVAQHAMIGALLRADVDAVCDDTNLSDRVVNALCGIAWAAGAQIAIHDMRDVPVEECIRRDALRPAPERVGRKQILIMAKAAGLA